MPTIAIVVDIQDVSPVPGQQLWKAQCSDTAITPGDDAEWQPAGANVEIVAVAFKGRSPIRVVGGGPPRDIEVLEPGGPGTQAALPTSPPGSMRSLATSNNPNTAGKYSYMILLRGTGAAGGPPARGFAKDPDIDII